MRPSIQQEAKRLEWECAPRVRSWLVVRPVTCELCLAGEHSRCVRPCVCIEGHRP